MRINKRSYFFTILSHFLIGSLIPIIAIVVLNMQSLTMIKDQTILGNQNTLNQVVRLMDTEIEKMTENCLAVASLSDVKKYSASVAADSNMADYLRYSIRRQLAEYNTGNLKDIFVYYPKEKYVISGIHGSMNVDDYYSIYYHEEGNLRRDFFYNLERASSHPMLHAMNPWGDQSYLCITLQAKGNKQSSYVVSVVMDAEYLTGLLQTGFVENGGGLLMFNQDKSLLLAGNKKWIPYNLDAYDGSPVPYEAIFDEEQYIMQVYLSSAINCYYAFATPSTYFWSQHREMQVFSIFAVVLIVAVCMVIAWHSSSRTYRPVRELLETLHGHEMPRESKFHGTNEFEFMKDYFRKEKAENKKLNERISANRQDQLIRQVLEGGIQETYKNAAIIEKAGGMLRSDCFAAGVIQVDEHCEWSSNEVSFALKNVFEEIFSRTDFGYIVYVSTLRYAFLVNLSLDANADHAREMLDEGKNFFQTQLGLNLTVGFSETEKGPHDIHNIYLQGIKALQYQYILGKNTVISYEDLEGREFAYNHTTPYNLYTRFDQYINQSNAGTNGEAFLTSIFAEYGINKEMSLETMECFKFDVINSIIHIALQYAISQERQQEIIQNLLNKETFFEFKLYLSHALDVLRSEHVSFTESAILCKNTRDYIEKHYNDPQLSLSLIGKEMGLSDAYLSRLYKQKYGISVPQEITKIRLQNAKRLLQETELNVAEIALQTGFSNSNVFIKVFKKWEGLTPGQYKMLLRSSKDSDCNA